ncbi:MAG: NAD-dependent epimerase/dehydratase [Bacteroidales bacterium]|jgi:CDP-paratose synthetase|nr:NAD-dependent epimerase/dehydratase [Bacteroidales bacterium]
MNILITGINGYLGSNIAKSLTANHNIIGLEYSLENLYRLQGCDFKVYSVENGVPDELFAENTIDTIIHTATFYGRQNEAVKTIANANLFIPFNLLDKAIKNDCKTFINTDTVLDRFVSTYALTKRHFQEWLYLRRNEIKMINMQLEHFYGPGAPETNFITAMIKRLKQNEPVIDLTAGEQQRDFIYIDDVVSAYQTVLNKQPLPKSYSEFQVSTKQLISINELLKTLKELTGSKSKLNFGAIPYRENELMRSETDNSDLIKLGWKPQFTIQKGLQNTI